MSEEVKNEEVKVDEVKAAEAKADEAKAEDAIKDTKDLIVEQANALKGKLSNLFGKATEIGNSVVETVKEKAEKGKEMYDDKRRDWEANDVYRKLGKRVAKLAKRGELVLPESCQQYLDALDDIYGENGDDDDNSGECCCCCDDKCCSDDKCCCDDKCCSDDNACKCCDKCTGEAGCDCGCDDCKCK